MTEYDNKFLQRLISVKVNRVFSSYIDFLESSPKFQLHKIKKYDSERVVTGFMRDYIY